MAKLGESLTCQLNSYQSSITKLTNVYELNDSPCISLKSICNCHGVLTISDFSCSMSYQQTLHAHITDRNNTSILRPFLFGNRFACMVRRAQTQPYFLLGIVASLLEETIAMAKVGFFTHLTYRNGLNTGNGVTLHDTF